MNSTFEQKIARLEAANDGWLTAPACIAAKLRVDVLCNGEPIHRVVRANRSAGAAIVHPEGLPRVEDEFIEATVHGEITYKEKL